ncbi:MAG: cupin domain-containing protein [Myxococcaceae bacterium]|nr:cupin domain-containing protein [Myxococcaceae bacterium]
MKVVRTSELSWSDAIQKGAYSQRRKELIAGEKYLFCSVWELAPGKKSFPLHAHYVTEEALYVLSGKAIVRTPDGETRIGPGDFVSFPPGGPAHQLVNDGTEPLMYLGMSANPVDADLVTYPDSGTVGARAGRGSAMKRVMFREKDQVDYYADDKDAQ